jgi:asparagine synthase (glutamine-hydrolysing)
MAGELQHRGPDGTGLYLHERFGMVSTQLALGDSDVGQPHGSSTGRYQVMHDGAIHNHDELRSELLGLGHRFAGRSTAEVLAHAFEEWGAACLERLTGEFAVAIWDERKRELFLARDAFGVRPLFIAELAGDFCFASEARALLRHPAARRELDPAAVVETFTLWSARPDKSSFVGIRELPAGCWLRYGPDGLLQQRQWWDIRFSGAAASLSQSGAQAAPGASSMPGRERVAELAAELRELLAGAVQRRATGGSAGVYISGGLDSSAIAALLQAGGQTPRGFSIGFADGRFDESEQQDAMAAALGIRLERIVISDTDIADGFPRAVELAERPMLRTAPVPLLLLARLARQHGCKTVLTGEGADELFGGYNIFKEAMIRRFWARQPESRLRPQLLRRLYPYLTTDLNRSGGLLGSYFGSGLQDTRDPLYSHHNRFRNGERNLRFLNVPDTAGREALGGLEASLPADFASLGPLSQAQYLEIHTFLQGYLLHSQGDRMLMGSSVTGRLPFLDPQVARFAARLPEGLRLRGLHEKYLLRKAVAPLLPAEVSGRRKRPYRAPLARPFLAGDAPDYVRDLLQPESLAATGLFNVELVGRLVAKCTRQVQQGSAENDEMALIGVLSTQLLQQQFVNEPRLAEPAVATRTILGGRAVTPAAAGL